MKKLAYVDLIQNDSKYWGGMFSYCDSPYCTCMLATTIEIQNTISEHILRIIIPKFQVIDTIREIKGKSQ